MRVNRTILALSAAVVGLATPATARPLSPATPIPMPRASAPAVMQGDGTPLKAWTELCDRMPAECAVDVTQPVRIELDRRTWDLLVAVNLRANEAIEPVSDPDHWGVADRWDFAEDFRGDCEDFSLVKRRDLIAAGLPRRALRMTVVINEVGEGHAVLTVLTDKGDLVLDNRTNKVMPWTSTGYRFVKRESQDFVGWVKFGPFAGPELTAARRSR